MRYSMFYYDNNYEELMLSEIEDILEEMKRTKMHLGISAASFAVKALYENDLTVAMLAMDVIMIGYNNHNFQARLIKDEHNRRLKELDNIKRGRRVVVVEPQRRTEVVVIKDERPPRPKTRTEKVLDVVASLPDIHVEYKTRRPRYWWE